MKSAILNGTLGLALSLGIGTRLLNLDASNILMAVVAANLGAVLGLLLTLQAEKVSWIRTKLLNRSLKTWSFMILIFLGVLLSIAPVMRDPHVLAYLIFPLVLSTGFGILIFGPIQDQIVRRQQRKELSQVKKKKSESQSDFPCFPTDSAVL
jgi:hypothetical protein